MAQKDFFDEASLQQFTVVLQDVLLGPGIKISYRFLDLQRTAMSVHIKNLLPLPLTISLRSGSYYERSALQVTYFTTLMAFPISV